MRIKSRQGSDWSPTSGWGFAPGRGAIFFLIVIPWLAASGALIANAGEAETPGYSRDIVPILRTYCVGCHNAAEANSDLAMHTFTALSKGGEHGPPIVPGKSGESRLYLMVTGKLEPKMPPADNPAPKGEEIARIQRWIDSGAKPPADPNEAIVVDPSTPEIAPKRAPKARVHSVAWSPDGKLIAIGGYGRVTLVDPKTSYIERVFSGPGGNTTAVSFSPDGSRLLAAGGRPGIEGKAVVWNVADGLMVRAYAGHADSLYAARMSPDQSILATAGYDKKILLWKAASGEVLRELKGHNDAVYALAFRKDGKVLASASGDRTVKLWDVASGERLDTFSQSLKELFSLTFSPDGSRLVAGGVDNRIRVWNVSESAKEGTNSLLESRFGHDGSILSLAVSGDGGLLASAASNRSVKLWQMPGVTELRSLERQSDWPGSLAFSPDGKWLLIGRQDGGISIQDVSTDGKSRELTPTEKPPPPPALVRKLPIAIRRGSSAKVELTGSHLAKTTSVNVNHAGLKATIPGDAARLDDRLTIDLAAAADVGPGRHELVVVTPGGQTAPLPVYVDTVDASHEPREGTWTIVLPTAAWGTLNRPGETDRVRFDAKAGQILVLDASAKEVGSKANLVLTIFAPDGRAALSASRTEGADDPLIVWTPPTDGTYEAQLHDLAYGGSEEHYYRLTIGALPFVTGVFPLVVPVGKETKVDLVGANLPAGASVAVRPDKAGDVALALDPAGYRWRRAPTVVAVPEVVVETEPNDAAASATRIAVPGEATGRFQSSEGGVDIDNYRFSARAGEEWIFETESARRGLPVDTRLDVLTSDGKPIERVWLAAVRDSYIEFRGLDSAQLEIRCKNWEEMELNEWMYVGGEVTKLFRHPRGPDSGFLFYPVGGRRWTYFDTTSTTHALEDPVYIVEPHAPGSKLASTGLPVFQLAYTNDDASGAQLGSDSRLTFRAASDGEYIVRVVDTRGATGPHHAYRLIARRPQPDFRVSLSNRTPSVHRGSGREASFSVQRIDGFEGEVEIQVGPLPDGLALSSPIKIEAGHESVSAVLTAAANAAVPTAEQLQAVRWKAIANIGGATVSRDVSGFERVTIEEAPKILVRLSPGEITIAPGSTVTAKLVVERHGHKDRVTFEMPGLPHGVIVDNIGLNGILIPEGQSEREVFLTARPWVPESDRPFFARANEVDGQSSAPVLLHVRRPSQVAKQ